MFYKVCRFVSLLILSVLVLTACSSTSKSNKNDDVQGVYTGKELEEYNIYINFSNNLKGEFLKTKESYFANYSNADLNYVTPDTTKEIFIPNVDQTHQSINDLKEMLQKKATLPLKKTAQSLIPEVRGEIEILEEMADYYETKEYTKDDFRKAKKLHDSLLKTTKKTNLDIASFNKEVDKLMEEQHLAKMEELKNNGDTVTYSLIQFIEDAEAVNVELQNQHMQAVNILKLDTCAYSLKYDKLVNTYIELETATKDKEKVAKSGFSEADIRTLKAKANQVKIDGKSIIERVESKEAITDDVLDNNTVLEKTTGTPEKLLHSYKNLVSEYADFPALN
ncbi:DUF3829 domain-containing protein [Listeria seeligeri]|uniref:DUF3829 domain-containing protein n=1 Tax=Listeria seeligeri TaxID=1640 RepID=UPI0022EA8CFD|nr:DUF3829 domain-containing protein [Listeria seeligeri]